MFYIYFKHNTWMLWCQWGAFKTEEARDKTWDGLQDSMKLPKVTMNGQDYYNMHEGFEYSKNDDGNAKYKT